MNSEQITIPIEMEIMKTMLTLASYDLISVNGKEKQNLSRVVCSFAGGGGVVVVGELGVFKKKKKEGRSCRSGMLKN